MEQLNGKSVKRDRGSRSVSKHRGRIGNLRTRSLHPAKCAAGGGSSHTGRAHGVEGYACASPALRAPCWRRFVTAGLGLIAQYVKETGLLIALRPQAPVRLRRGNGCRPFRGSGGNVVLYNGRGGLSARPTYRPGGPGKRRRFLSRRHQ